ncbi:MAG: TIGR03086 family metal-binding protein [Ilumatobacteraceae bacterium]
MEPTEQLTVILPALSDLVDKLGPADLDKPTPCTNFAVRDVLDHMIVGGSAFSYLFRGVEPPEVPARRDDGRVPAAEFRNAMRELLGAVHGDGALQRTIPSPIGEMPGDTFARLVAFDGLVHGWDIARATELDWELPDELVKVVDEFARAALSDDLRDGETFKAATSPPTAATPIERLAAFSGRTV